MSLAPLLIQMIRLILAAYGFDAKVYLPFTLLFVLKMLLISRSQVAMVKQ